MRDLARLSLPGGEGGEVRSTEPGGASGFDRRENHLHYRIQLAINFRICETKHLISTTAQILIASQVPFPIPVETMLRAIYFNDHTRPAAFEIGNVVRDRRLATEMVTQRAKLAKFHPELDFLGRHRFPPFFRAIGLAMDRLYTRNPTRLSAARFATLP